MGKDARRSFTWQGIAPGQRPHHCVELGHRHAKRQPALGWATSRPDRRTCVVLGEPARVSRRESVAELKGVKLRVLPTKAFIDTFTNIGAVPTPIPINELYTAAQTGVVDGFEHDPGTVLAYKFYEVDKYCFLTQHYYSPMLAYIGKRGLSKITLDLMPKFMQAAAEATKQERADVPKVENEASVELKAKGVVFTEVPPAERKAMAENVAKTLYPAFANQYPVTKQVFEKIAATRG